MEFLNKCAKAYCIKLLPEFFWRTLFPFFKNPVEVRYIIKTTFKSNFINTMRSIYEHTGCIAKSYFCLLYTSRCV